ncbi:MAG: Gfo/Idh/MocA family oxidoreductase [Roseburia sp.]|nr:Gfo/Idh/MocA family oxidoreductase [Roseburia sp.]
MVHNMAIIGYGGMGGWHHSSIREMVPELRVKGAYDIRQEIQQKISANGLHAYQSVEELLADETVELVTIAVPNNFHKDYAIACLKAGKNVVCEKPVTLNAAELEEIIAVSKEEGKLFTVHQNRRWDRDYRVVKNILESGVIGKPYFIETRVQGSRGSMHGWRGYKENGGGMLYDWGVHLLDQLLDMIPSRVVSVSAHLESVFTEEVDDNVKLMLLFENGVSALMEFSTNCFINHPRWHVSCTEGTAVVENWECDGKIVKLAENAEQMKWEDDIVYTAAGPTRTMAPRPAHTTQVLELPKVDTKWEDYYRNIVGVLEQKEELIVKPEQALRVMKLIDMVFGAVEHGGIATCYI